jgi:hypothetical protein
MMWKHLCKVERGWLLVANGEPCNWCEAPPNLTERLPDEYKTAAQNNNPTTP